MMSPLYFESQGEWLFAWVHRGESAGRCQQGVIICPPLGHEQVHAQRGLRHLANALAEAGFPVLRFDYHGTGDSAGDLEDANRHATWLANLRSALRWLEDEFGCTQITLVGLRLGAALAVQVAAEIAVAGLILWAPVVKGRAYVREMKALGMAAGSPAAAGNDIEAAGFVISEQTVRDISGIDLIKTKPQCRRALIVDRDDLPADAKLLDHLRGLGIDTQQIVQPGYTGLMAEPHLTQVPVQAIAEMVTWMRGACPCDKRTEIRAESALRIEAVVANLPDGPLRERAVTICELPNLVGILSEPPVYASLEQKRPAIVLLNAGSAYRVGPNRLHVLLARRLAARGFPCLRMDLNGLGDSINPDSARENDPYPATAFRDIDLALRFLGRQLGVEQVILMGLCSGAYAAFQAAAQFQDGARRGVNHPVLTIVESVIINPLTFYWQEGMTVESAQSIKFKAFHESMTSARRPDKWLKLLTGRSKLGIKGALRILLDRWQLRWQTRRQNVSGGNDNGSVSLPSHPKVNDLASDLTRIVKNNRQLTFFFARSDPGYDLLTFYASRQVEEMCRTGQMRINFIEDADHTFSQRGARAELIQAICDNLTDGPIPKTGTG